MEKTLHGQWLTPLPVEWITDEELNANTPEGTFCFITVRGHMRMRVVKRVLDDDDLGKRVERFVTLSEEETGFTINGKANINYNRILFSNGVQWVRAPKDKLTEGRGTAEVQEEAVHGAPEDAVQPSTFCGFMCGSKPSKPGGSDTPKEHVEELPPPKDLSDGFFTAEQVEDIVDRINDVVGIWGVSEDTEKEYIKPPVEKMNKIIKECLQAFVDNPLVDLFQYFLDETMNLMTKAKALARYLNDRFVKPLTEALLQRLEEEYQTISWIRDKVARVVNMMAKMVTEELMSKTMEGITDSSVADCEAPPPS